MAAPPLTPKQQAFINAYLADGMNNASAAYRMAYPTSRKWTAAAVAREAQRGLSHPLIRPLIDEARQKAHDQAIKVVDRFIVTKERISAALARLAFSDARRLYKWTKGNVELLPSDDLHDDDAAAVISVSSTPTANGNAIKITLGDKRQALMDLAKLHGHIVEKRDVRVIKSVQDLTDEELLAIIAVPGVSDGTPVTH